MAEFFANQITDPKEKPKLWPGGKVPYEISEDYNADETEVILKAMDQFHDKTHVHFSPRKGKEEPYIRITLGHGCSSMVGMAHNKVHVTLDHPCLQIGIVIHELLHALGFQHEHKHPHRDKYVRINWDNIMEGKNRNFEQLTFDDGPNFFKDYDYESIMHYGKYTFAINQNIPTIEPYQDGAVIGQNDGFSAQDLIKVNAIY